MISIHLLLQPLSKLWIIFTTKFKQLYEIRILFIPGGNSTLIRRVCATSILNLSPCSGVGKPKKDTLLWSYRSFLKSIVLYCIVLYCIVLYCIVLYCIVLYCIGDKDHVYALLIQSNDSTIPLNSVMFVQKNFKFFITVISLSYDICSAFQDWQHFTILITFYMLR